MTKKYYFLLIWLLLFFACSSSPVEKQKPPPNPHLQVFIKEYVSYFEALLEQTHTPGASLAIIKDTTVLHLSGYGNKTVFSNDAVDINTIFRLGSLSKGFAAILAGILVENGDLKWTDKVNKYVPEFVFKDSLQSNRVNLIHLLSQSSGLPYHAYTNLVEAGLNPKEIAQQFKKVNLIAEEGIIYAYQNAAFSLIGSVMEAVKKQPLSEIFNKELFQSLKLNNASTDYESLINANNLALPHRGGKEDWHIRPVSKKYFNAIPAGGINASIADMAEWMQLLLGNQPTLISQKTLNEIFLPRINTNNKNRYFHDWPMINEAYYGLGWRVLTNPQDTFIYHGGFVNGYRGEILIYPKDKLGICVLANAPSELPNNAIPVFLEKYAERRDSINAWEWKGE